MQDATSARAAFAAKRNYTALDYGPILSSNWFYAEPAMAGIRVQAAYVTSLAAALLAFGLTSGLGYAALTLIKRVTS